MKIAIDKGLLILNGEKLNVRVNTVSCSGEIIWKEETMLLESGKERTFNGYDASTVQIAATIFESEQGSTKFDNLKTLNNAFKAMEDKTASLWKLEGDVFRAVDITQARFVNFAFSENTDQDSIDITIELREEQPKVSAVQDQQKVVDSATEEPTVDEVGVSADEEKLIKSVTG